MSSPSQKNSRPIYVLKSIIPPIEEFKNHVDDIWQNRQFTNDGPKHWELTDKLCNFLEVEDLVLVGNGTYALVAALAAFDFEPGEVITTPFTFVATAHCLKPFNLTPKFVDIEPNDLTIDPKAVEAAITPQTRAIMAVHVYGNPCYIESLQEIADRHNLKIIYDAAHAFGVTYKGKSIFEYGDASCVSFHATKAFHTFEGGAVFSQEKSILDFVRRYKNFGIEEGVFVENGLNTKMSEIHAAIGLVNLAHYNEHVSKRADIYERYRRELSDIVGLSFVSFERQDNANYNYCPILFKSGRDALFEKFKEAGIFTRKYFYPLLTDMPAYAEYKENFPVASRVAEEILCLPIYSDLSEEEQSKIIEVVRSFK